MSNFQTTILRLYGPEGQKWLHDLPQLIHRVADWYSLYQLKPVANLSYNYVLTGMHSHPTSPEIKDTPIVLKISLDKEGLLREAEALKAFADYGAVPMISEDIEKNGLIILKQALPGRSLRSYFPFRERDSLAIASMLMQRCHRAPLPSHHHFPSLRERMSILDQSWDIPLHYLHKARYYRDLLIRSSLNETLLHGDLHHDNILEDGSDWVFIDPKGLIGDPAYEASTFIGNPIPYLWKTSEGFNGMSAQEMIQKRIIFFAETFKCPPERIQHWCFVHAVLAWAWALEDNGDPTCWYHYAVCIDD